MEATVAPVGSGVSEAGNCSVSRWMLVTPDMGATVLPRGRFRNDFSTVWNAPQ